MPLTGLSKFSQRIESIHSDLAAHFRGLRTLRDSAGDGSCVFAIEHGLSTSDLGVLADEVRSAIRNGHVAKRTTDPWLPYVVYAAEIGFEYRGEYWDTFEERTPGWRYADRTALPLVFGIFARRYGGAQPRGSWASFFSNICWPVTHAVLPADLQVQLVRLLYDLRWNISSDLLQDSKALGTKLSSYADGYSQRFEIFSDNTELLGQVARALLLDEGEESSLLLDSTLLRIVRAINEVKEARLWLKAAQSRANRINKSGFLPVGRPPRNGTESIKVRLPNLSDPIAMLESVDGSWRAYLQLPDLTELGERIEVVGEALKSRRAVIAGVRGAPIARQKLLRRGDRVRLSEWPFKTPIIQLEGASSVVNHLLADQCLMSAGPHWVFLRREEDAAIEVRSKTVRPGRSYILLSELLLDSSILPDWIEATNAEIEGVVAHEINVPNLLEEDDIQLLKSLGLASIVDIRVRPAGLTPAFWDGEGSGEWMLGESPILALASSQILTRCDIELDGYLIPLTWPVGKSEMLVKIGELPAGSHRLSVALIDGSTERWSGGEFSILIRPPVPSRAEGSFREALQILTKPENPSLSELWDGKASLAVLGPPETKVWISVSFPNEKGHRIGSKKFEASLPITQITWDRLWTKHIVADAAIQRLYPMAQTGVVTVAHKVLGSVETRFEREFAPIRWAHGPSEAPFVKLINNTQERPEVRLFEYSAPLRPIELKDEDDRIIHAAGGLVRAIAKEFQSSAILTPPIRDFGDLHKIRTLHPRINNIAKTVDGILELVEGSQAWATASLPPNPFGPILRATVLRSFARTIACVIAGGRWRAIEEKGAKPGGHFDVSDLRRGIGVEAYQQDLAKALRSECYRVAEIDPEQRVGPFFEVLNHFGGKARAGLSQGMAEFLLRLASSGTPLTVWSRSDVREFVDITLCSPVLIRAARFFVLAIHSSEDEANAEDVYRGWKWAS